MIGSSSRGPNVRGADGNGAGATWPEVIGVAGAGEEATDWD